MFVEAYLFLAAYILTWPALAIVLLLGIAFEHTGNRKSAVFAGLVAMAISYFYFDVPLSTIWGYGAGYLVVGLLWSFWRYKLYVAKMVAGLSERVFKSQKEKTWAVERLLPSNNLERITSWIIVWPFSVIEHTLGDIITLIQTLVTRFFKGVYYRFYLTATKDLLATPVVEVAEEEVEIHHRR